MSISTSTYQHISFSKFLLEAEGLTVKDITTKWSSVVPYRQKYINKEEIDRIGDLIALPENSTELMMKAVRAVSSGTPIRSAADARNVVYDKPINGNVFVFEDENIKQMEKMLRQKELGRKIVTDLEKAHIEKKGITLDSDQVYKVDKLANLKAMISLILGSWPMTVTSVPCIVVMVLTSLPLFFSISLTSKAVTAKGTA